MRKSLFSDAQIMGVLRQAEAGMSVPDLCRVHGISSATFYKWRSKYGGVDASLISQMKALEVGAGQANDPVNRLPGRTTGA